jgi:peroxiredoxin
MAPPGGEAKLAAPVADRERGYLGLPGGAADFVLSDVRADVLIVDLFDMYCHVCQKTAPKVNALFALLEKRGYGGRIKMIGVAVGDTPLEAETFRRKFQVPFPVLADRVKAVSAEFGNEKRPCLLVLKKREGRLSVIFSHTGSIDDIEATLEAILKAAGP